MTQSQSEEEERLPTKWLRALTACGPVLPSLIALFLPSSAIPPFTPRQFINDNNLWSLIFGIWATPTSFYGHLSRLLQAIFVYLLPASTFQYYQFWIITAALRTGTGQLFTRTLGWAAPRFFSHWSLYETCGGYGPPIAIYLFLYDGPEALKYHLKQFSKVPTDFIIFLSSCAVFCWLENAPWTYGVATLGAGALALGRWAFLHVTSVQIQQHPFLLDNQRRPTTLTLKAIIASSLLTLLTISIPYEIRYRMTTFVPTRMPSAHSPSSPLLEILILSFPRPNPDVATTIMATTINSFIPHLTSNITLSVFTHSTSHTAFANVQRMFASTNVTFYTDNDTHADHWPGQYLHIAEAFRWAMQRSNHAEWVMLVEDDFPMCAGDRGWDALKKVMQILESQISARSGAHAQGGFIGTGGSGLIIHHTMLPILILLMHTHAEIASKLPPTSIRRPADLVMQDCLLGTDPLCARGDGKLVITSRLIMDHIGGMVTTNAYKALNDDKWRCGWRHAFHGYPNVEVVVV